MSLTSGYNLYMAEERINRLEVRSEESHPEWLIERQKECTHTHTHTHKAKRERENTNNCRFQNNTKEIRQRLEDKKYLRVFSKFIRRQKSQ